MSTDELIQVERLKFARVRKSSWILKINSLIRISMNLLSYYWSILPLIFQDLINNEETSMDKILAVEVKNKLG